MKSIGVVRNVDSLGRVVIPKEIRTILGFEEGQAVEIYTEGTSIMLKRYTPGCHCCGEAKIETNVLGLDLCKSCINEFAKAKKMIDELR